MVVGKYLTTTAIFKYLNLETPLKKLSIKMNFCCEKISSAKNPLDLSFSKKACEVTIEVLNFCFIGWWF